MVIRVGLRVGEQLKAWNLRKLGSGSEVSNTHSMITQRPAPLNKMKIFPILAKIS